MEPVWRIIAWSCDLEGGKPFDSSKRLPFNKASNSNPTSINPVSTTLSNNCKNNPLVYPSFMSPDYVSSHNFGATIPCNRIVPPATVNSMVKADVQI
jgi:hypothetical protein